ncbi:MAG: LapA family protein [Actinomycetota bacterium]|nr:LapA family protein [Actinomycetota bacterium]
MAARDDHGGGIEYRGTGYYAGLSAALVIAAALLAFAVQNTGAVTVEFLWLDVTAPLFAWVIGASLLAVIADELVGLIWRDRERDRLSRAAAGVRDESTTATEPGATDVGAAAPAAADLAEQTHRYTESRR